MPADADQGGAQPSDARMPLETYRDVVFEDQRVELDDCQFINCRFERCQLIYRGSGSVGLQQCGFKDCGWDFADAAGRTLAFMRDLHRSLGNSAEAWVSMLFDDQPPPPPGQGGRGAAALDLR